MLMLAATVWNQSGGQGKSTLTRDLAGAYAELGLKVLIVDFDAQNGSVSNYLNADTSKHDSDADDISFHMTGRAQGPFSDLIVPVEGEQNIDVIPSHKRFLNIGSLLDQHDSFESETKPDGWEYPRFKRFYQVIKENNVPEAYDVMLVDPNAKADEALYLALYATRNLVIPTVPTRGGMESIEGVRSSASGFASKMDVNITNAATVPMMVKKNKNLHQEYAQRIHEKYRSPVYLKHLSAYEKAEENFTTVFKQLQEGRMRDYNADIMPKLRTLAGYLYTNAGYDLPDGGWDEDDLWQGDDFWGEIDIADFTRSKSEQTVVN